jgi:hypothetical protein
VILETFAMVADRNDIGIPLPAYSSFPLYFETYHEWDILDKTAPLKNFVKEQIRESICVVTGCETQ